jgi:dTMP kinase
MAFIAFEGLDGSGKSTLIDRLAKQLKSSGQTLVLTREPGGTPLAEAIRGLLLRTGNEVPVPRTEVLLYEAARAQHVESVIRPALKMGQWVLCDRFYASTVAFQAFARGLNRADIDWLNNYATAGLKPELTVLLDLPVDISLARMNRRNRDSGQGDDRFEAEKKGFHESVRRGYLQQANEDPAGWLVLDAQRKPEEIFSDLIKVLEERGWLSF